MVNWNRDTTITALITPDGPSAMGSADGEAKKISEALGGGIGIFYDKEDGQTYVGVAGVVTGKRLALVYEYDFDVHGGAISTIELSGPQLPANFRIINGFIEVLEDMVGASGTVSLGTKAAAKTNLLAATAIGSLTAGDIIQLIPDSATLSDSVKETTAQSPVMAIATTAQTAGRFKVVLEGFIIA